MARAKVIQPLIGKTRTLFEGLEDEARTYIQNNFPRPHVEPGTVVEAPPADVQLVKEDGSKETYHAENGWTAVGAEAGKGSDLA